VPPLSKVVGYRQSQNGLTRVVMGFDIPTINISPSWKKGDPEDTQPHGIVLQLGIVNPVNVQ